MASNSRVGISAQTLAIEGEGDRVNLTIGSLDDPVEFPATGQLGIESRLLWFAELCTLPKQSPTEASCREWPHGSGRAIASTPFMIADVHILDRSAVPTLISLWRTCGLVRPWNDPEHDAIRAIDAADGDILGIEVDGGLAGSAMVGFDGHRGWVYYLAVAPHARRRGLGRALMDAAEDWLKARGAPKIQLMVREDNALAIDFYTALGLDRQPVTTFGRFLSVD